MIAELGNELKKIIEEITASDILPVYTEEEDEATERAPKVFHGFLAPEDAETLIPAICIRTILSKNSLEERRLLTKITIAIFNKDSMEGYEILYSMLEKIMNHIIEKGIIGEKFEVLPEAEWLISEEQPYPYWIGEIKFSILMAKKYRTDLMDWLDGEKEK